MSDGRAINKQTDGRRYPAGALLVLGLLLAHLFLMAHEPSHEQHTAHDMSASAAARPTLLLLAMPAAPTTPRSVLDGCPVAQATLPGALLLLLLAFAFCTRSRLFSLSSAQTALALVRPPPSPPPAARRRALLQVFLI